jgi:RimJ/RimL family protein N-acetyltransferase
VTTPVRQLKNVARELGLRRGLDIIQRKEPYRSELIALGLRRDLHVSFTAPDAKIPITVRRLETRDFPVLFDTSAPDIDDEERALRRARQELASEGIGTGFVAVTETDDPCYVQWLFGPDENAEIRRYFERVFPPLRKGEALLEGAFTPVQHRGKGIMPAAMARIAEQAAALDARFVITFVTEDNIPSLKGCDRAGFSPYVRRRDAWIGIRRSITFTALSEGAPVSHDT